MLAVLLIGGVVGWFANYVYLADNIRKTHLSSATLGLSIDFKLIESLDKQGSFNSELKKQYDQKFFSIVRSLIIIKPDFDALAANSTQTICRLIEYHSNYKIEVDKATNELVNDYLSQIEPTINKNMSEVQKYLGGEGCTIGGKSANNKVCRYSDPARCKKNET